MTATDQTVTTEWVVHIQGMDDTLPALGRVDAHQRAQKANADILAWEQVRKPSSIDAFRPTVWAVPLQRNDRPQTVTKNRSAQARSFRAGLAHRPHCDRQS